MAADQVASGFNLARFGEVRQHSRCHLGVVAASSAKLVNFVFRGGINV